ncbi:MAG: carboxymuconolactone decarboxylase family protein [Actinomycetota bacterium]
MDFGAAVGARSGVDAEDLAALEGDYRASDRFTDLEKDVIELAERLTSTPSDVPQELYDAVAGALTGAQLVELVETIATENHRARFNRAFDIGSQDFCQIRR